MAGFGENGGLFPYMASSVRRVLFSREPVGQIMPNVDGWTCERLDWIQPELQSQRRRLHFLFGLALASGSWNTSRQIDGWVP